jgi:hypothetical protein
MPKDLLNAGDLCGSGRTRRRTTGCSATSLIRLSAPISIRSPFSRTPASGSALMSIRWS